MGIINHESNHNQRISRVLLLTMLLFSAGFVWAIAQANSQPNVRLSLSSDPFPLAVGQADLHVELAEVDGTPIDGAVIDVYGEMHHAGMLPVAGRLLNTVNGEYQRPVILPMAGYWNFDVSVTLPDQRGRIEDRFSVFVYGVPRYTTRGQSAYLSVRELDAVTASIPERELWVIIPQGTGEIFLEGQGNDLIPTEIRLQVSGRNVLVIRNDDFVDHIIGPFFVRAGETVRQEFTQPAIFQGTCSINIDAELNIIIEP